MPDSPDIQALIQQLEAEREELDVTIAHLRKRAGLPVGNGDSRQVVSGDGATGRDAAIVTGRIRPDEFFRLSIADSIKKLLEIMKQPLNPMAIVNGLKAGGVLTNAKNFYANVNTELKRMKARDLVVNTPSGWGLTEWYPNKPKTEAPKPKKRAKGNGTKARGAKTRAERRAATSRESDAAQGSADSAKPGGWMTFLAEQRAAGKSMKEAGALWKEQQKNRQGGA